MQLRTFVADDMRQALVRVRSEMGDCAIIVASEKTKSGVLVRAAFDGVEEQDEAAIDAPEEPEASTSEPSFEQNYRDGLIKRLRGESSAPAATAAPFHRAELLAILGKHRLPDSLAHDIAKTAEQSLLKDMTLALACALDRRMKPAPLDIANSTALLLVGPNGAGKTATAAKIAAHARLSHRSVKLIAADPDGAGAIARLEAFATHLRVPIVIAETTQALQAAIAAAVAEKSLTIIDTAGFDPRNDKARTVFQALATLDNVEAVGVISAAADAEETAEIIAALGLLGAQRLIVTGTDLPRRFGALVAASCASLGLAHVTRSPFVAAGLDSLTPLALARMLMNSTANGADRGSAQ